VLTTHAKRFHLRRHRRRLQYQERDMPNLRACIHS
jgi:hypothetical protein